MSDRLPEVIHDAYEVAAAQSGWETNPASRKPWADVPESNRRATEAAARAARDFIAAEKVARVEELEAQHAAVLALHQRYERHNALGCEICGWGWPCETAAALGVTA